jgi:hypothetical protein
MSGRCICAVSPHAFLLSKYGAPSINMASGFRADYGPPPLAGEAHVTYIPGDHHRSLIRGIRLSFPFEFRPSIAGYLSSRAIMPSALPSKVFTSATLIHPCLPSMPSPKPQPHSKHGLMDYKPVATLRPLMDNTLVLVLDIPLASGFRASSTHSLIRIIDTLSPSFPARPMHQMPSWKLSHKSRAQ